MYNISQIADEYKNKLITAANAAEMIKDGSKISYGLGCSTPHDFDIELGKRFQAKNLSGIQIVNATLVVDEPYAAYTMSESADQVTFASAHFNGFDRKINKDGRCWFIPMLFNELPTYWKNIDVAVLQTGPMDKWGNFNIGPQVADLRGILANSKKIILEVNEKMPRAFGYETEINIADIDYVIEGSNSDIPTLPGKPATEIDEKVADYVVDLIEDGSTLQLGIGGLPAAIGTKLAKSDVKDLSVHTEMLVDSFEELYAAGKITGNKNRDKGKIVYTFAGGSKKLYDFIDDNPILFSAPVDYVNNIGVVASIDKFISINGCINLDLYGQVCSESAGYRHISGTGGQLDFVQGAYASEGGKSFICLNSTRTFKDGHKESLIRPTLQKGAVVTTPRSATHYIVTEYGTAMLKGKSTWERAERLINIAHPDFRDELIAEAEKMGIWTKTSKVSY